MFMHSSRRVARAQFPQFLVLVSAGCLAIVSNASAQTASSASVGSASVTAVKVASVKRVQVLGNRTPIEIEIEGSEQLVPNAQVLTGPDRLVVDFANAAPAAQLRNQTLNRGEVKGVRIARFSEKPAVTRVVFDLNSPLPYQIFPSGRTVIIKLGKAGAIPLPAAFTPATSGARLVTTTYPVITAPEPPPPPLPLLVTFINGNLTISSHKANLSEVLSAIHQRTGAEIAIPAGAEQEQVVAEMGPAPAPEVLSKLLNGSKFNFLILSSAADPAMLDRVILSARPEGPAPAYHALPQMPPMPAEEESENAPPPPGSRPGGNPNPAADQGSGANPGGGAGENPPQ
jgi:hypothetical protein